MPPLSYSADISDVFLVSFVSMMEHDRQFHDKGAPWRNSGGCPIEFLFSGQYALQRMLCIYLFNRYFILSLTGHQHRRLPQHSQPTFLSLWQLKMILVLKSWNIFMIHLFGRLFCSLWYFFHRFQPVLSSHTCHLWITLFAANYIVDLH